MEASLNRTPLALLLGLILLVTAGASASAEGERGFTVTIDGVAVPIDPGETVSATLKDGRGVKVTLGRSPVTSFSNQLLSFQHPSSLSAATQKIADGITQHTVMTAAGTIIIVQEYEEHDPAVLVEKMMTQLTQDDVKAGGELKTARVEKALKSGLRMQGLQGVLKSQPEAEVTTYEVFTYSKDGRGVLFITTLADDNRENDQGVIDGFWKTLQVKF